MPRAHQQSQFVDSRYFPIPFAARTTVCHSSPGSDGDGRVCLAANCCHTVKSESLSLTCIRRNCSRSCKIRVSATWCNMAHRESKPRTSQAYSSHSQAVSILPNSEAPTSAIQQLMLTRVLLVRNVCFAKNTCLSCEMLQSEILWRPDKLCFVSQFSSFLSLGSQCFRWNGILWALLHDSKQTTTG